VAPHKYLSGATGELCIDFLGEVVMAEHKTHAFAVIGEPLDDFIAHWQRKRDGSLRGIVEIVL